MSFDIHEAEAHDLPSILALQKLSYQSEAELIGDYTMPPLVQTLDGITDDFTNGIILKAVDNSGENAIIGSVRVRFVDGNLYIGRLIVDPTRQNQGIGSALLLAAEVLYPNARYELFTGSISTKNLYLYRKHGYVEFKREPLNSNADIVFLEKTASFFDKGGTYALR